MRLPKTANQTSKLTSMGFKHRKASQFSKSGLFRGLHSFSELEDRVSALPRENRGDAFEVFAEAYISTQKSLEADEVWPEGTIPESILRKFNLPPKDLGVDGVFRTWSNEYHGYQVKFRSGRPSLTWDELSTFMGLTDEVDQRVLFTNCDDFPAVMNERSKFYCIRGNDLDRLTGAEFRAIEEWLDTGTFQPKRKTPYPHNEEALENILSGLRTNDRVTSIMACATGKTLVGLWLAERLGSRRILVLVPSLALVRQTLHEWLKETEWSKPRFRCVCSDPTVTRGADEIVIHQSDADFPVSTKVSEVEDFLRAGGGDTQIVFSTYHSAHVVAEAMRGSPPFELGIFDEAHKTAGREGTRDSFALSDDNLPIKKRVFLTATPRHYDVSKKDKEGDSKLVYSMDDPQTYGPRAHTLTFAEAARRKIICDYKIIISIVTSDMVNDALLRRGEVIVEGDAVKARQVANQIALQTACEIYDLKKIFTFHRNVASAQSFTGTGGQSISAHLPDFKAFHVNGEMNTARREHFMKEFAEADRAVMSNARCLTEGVNVPSVDVVAFLSPKKSTVDIVQATGRAMRKSPGKERGYIFLPLFLETAKNETVEEALERTDFQEVWNVLEAMQEQDEALADVIRQMREERGRRGGFDDTRLRERVEVLGPEISLDVMRAAVSTSIVDHLGVTWDERFGELVAYKRQHRDCNVPQKWPENQQLARVIILIMQLI